MFVRIDTIHGPLKREIDLPEGEITLAALARAVLPLATEIETIAARRAIIDGHASMCRKGCDACCCQLVTVSPAEAWMLAEHIATLPDALRNLVESKYAAALAAVEKAGLLEKMRQLDDPGLSPEEHFNLARDYFRLKVPCPLLGAGACRIYTNRPALCREYLVSSSPTRCLDPFKYPPDRVPVVGEVSQALLGTCAQSMGHELEPIPFILAPEWAKAHAKGGARLWNAARLMERFLLYLEVSLGQQAQNIK